MTDLRWSVEQVAAFIHHPEYAVRQWALDRLIKRFPDRSGDLIASMLADTHTYIVMNAATFIGATGDRERYGPRVLDQLARAGQSTVEYCAQAAGQLGVVEAVPLLLERLQSTAVKNNPSAFGRVIEAVGRLGGEQARSALWSLLEHTQPADYAVGDVAQAVLQAAQPGEIDRFMHWYRHKVPAQFHPRILRPLADVSGVSRLYDELLRAAPGDLGDLIGFAEDWLETELPFAAESLASLAQSFKDQAGDVYTPFLREAKRLIEQRGDAVATWREDWQAGARPIGYRSQAVFTLAVLQAFAARPTSRVGQWRAEFMLGLALLAQLSVDQDDEARLGQAVDRNEMLLTILAENREHVLPDIIEQVAALGPSTVPRLLELFVELDDSWGQIRIAQVIGRLARLWPGSCDVAIPVLLDLLDDSQGDFILEAITEALEAIGPAALEPLAVAMRSDDLSRQIYSTGALGEIPTDRAAEAILDWITERGYAEEGELSALKDIGSPLAITPLAAMYTGDLRDNALADALLVLCEINQVDHPLLSEWRARVHKMWDLLDNSHDTWLNRARFRGYLELPTEKSAAQPMRSLHARPKSVGKQEQKKRAAQKRRNQKKKRK